MKKLLQILLAFFRIGALTFGGGYSMLPIAERELVRRRGWVSEAEVSDAYALSQCLPGIISVNTAAFIGHKIGGGGKKSVLYGVVAAVGVVLPSLIIIVLIAAFLSNFAELEAVQKAFAGIRVCVLAMILNTIVRMRVSALTNLAAWIIFAAVLLLSMTIDLSPVVFVVAAIIAGVLIAYIKGLKKSQTKIRTNGRTGE